METIKAAKPKQNMDLIAAVLFTVLALIQCYFLTNTVQLYGRFNVFVLIRLLWLAACVLTAVALYRRKRDRTGKGILFIGLGILTFMTFYDFFNGFRTNAYAVYESYYSYYSGLHSSYHFNLFCMIPSLIQVVGYLGILALAVVQLTGYAQKYREQTKMLWFVPAVLIAASLILGVIFSILFSLFGNSWTFRGVETGWNLLIYLLTTAAFLLSACWIAYPDGLERKQKFPSGQAGTSGVPPVNGVLPPESGYIDMVKCVLLLIFTFGIYWLIWIYRTTRYLNRVEGEVPRTPVSQLLLCMFVPFYQIYWVYQSAKRIDKLAAYREIASEMTVICLVLAIFVPIIAPMIMQDKINSVAMAEAGPYMSGGAAPSGGNRQNVPPAAPGASSPGGYTAAPSQEQSGVQAQSRSAAAQGMRLGVAEELKMYKELLDEGVITQEEFDRKKQQLLNL